MGWPQKGTKSTSQMDCDAKGRRSSHRRRGVEDDLEIVPFCAFCASLWPTIPVFRLSAIPREDSTFADLR